MAGVRRSLRYELLDLRRSPTLCLRSDGNGCVLDVTDGAPAVTPKVVRGRPVAEGGVGLVLALALSSEVGWYVTAQRELVWARFVPHAM